MFKNNPRKLSYIISFSAHVVLLIIFIFIKFSLDYEDDEYLTIGFGRGGNVSKQGTTGAKIINPKENPPIEKQKEKAEIQEKKVELPKTVNADNENVIKEADKKKEKEETQPAKVKPLIQDGNGTAGKETAGEGDGYSGFDIDFGGRGKRKIYSYILPEYPEGVSKEIDVKLRFSIQPDGTIGKIFPLMKADAKLESAAINSLRQWRFEPLPEGVKQIEQTVVIIFPYRLR